MQENNKSPKMLPAALNRTELQEERHNIQQKYKNDEWETSYLLLKKHKDYFQQKRSSTFRFVTPSVPDLKVLDNQIQTSKYNFFTFIPKNLFIQFSKLAHIYFIIVGICQMFREISTTNGQPLVYIPFGIITFISMIKDFIEDWQRHVADKKENDSLVNKYNPSTQAYEEQVWSSLRIGDMIKINEDEQFPADILILQTTSTNGDCFVETKNLDGETSLKRKIGVQPSVFQPMNITEDRSLLKFQLKYEQPNQQMYFFNGVLTDVEGKQQYAVNINNVCLRGSSLKATSFIYGMVVYTGHQTKILLNSQRARYKFSRIELIMNKMILWIFLILLSICIFCSTYYNIWYHQKSSHLSYLGIKARNDFEEHTAESFFLMLPLWYLLLGNFVPISLMVTIELVKFSQGLILQRDRNYRNINDDQFVEVKSSNLCEELGRINYIFSDKTGTLTINQMNFKAISLNQNIYQDKNDNLHSDVIFKSDKLSAMIESETLSSSERLLEMEGMKCLNLCHTLMIEEKNGELNYCGTSPDEESILKFCKNQGFYFCKEDINGTMTIQSNSSKREQFLFRKIAVLEFDFERKKMSVIVEDLETNEFKLYCKGADMNIFSICSETQKDNVQITEQHLHDFSVRGLRTLAFGYRIISKQEVDDYIEKLQNIKRDIHDQEEKIFKLHVEIEKDLILLGGTGINDRLQDDVEYTLKNLKEAGIKIWMLTGDKIETAENIALQCKLLHPDTDLLTLDSEVYDQKLETEIEKYYAKIAEKTPYCVLLAGYTLNAIDLQFGDAPIDKENLNVLQKLKTVLFHSQAVIASKITPKQKAQIVSIVKKMDSRITTLAIGDGANDVSMIATAHVGIGIRGKEGRQAAKFADFSIGEFRHLNRLILYQGQESYRKNSQLVYFNFYKNQVGFLTYFWFNFFAGQSGAYFYDQWVKQLYNLIFTALPIIIYCLFDELYPAHEYCTIIQTLPNKLERMPYFYRHNMKHPAFTIRQFWKEFFTGSLQSLIITFIGMACLSQNPHREGYPTNHMESGMLIFAFAVIVPNLKVFSLHNTHYPFTILIILAGIGLFFICLVIANKIRTLASYGLFSSIFSTTNTYLGIVLMLVTIYGFERARQIWCTFERALRSHSYEKEVDKNTLPKAISESSPTESAFPSARFEVECPKIPGKSIYCQNKVIPFY